MLFGTHFAKWRKRKKLRPAWAGWGGLLHSILTHWWFWRTEGKRYSPSPKHTYFLHRKVRKGLLVSGQEPATNKTVISETGSTWGGVHGCNYGIFALTKEHSSQRRLSSIRQTVWFISWTSAGLFSALRCQGVWFQGCGRLWLSLGYFGLLGPKKAVGQGRGALKWVFDPVQQVIISFLPALCSVMGQAWAERRKKA